jgi:hypothetical protein
VEKMLTRFNSALIAGAVFIVSAGDLSARDASNAAQALEQVPDSAYARAEAVVPQHVRELIYGMSVRPQWIGKTSRFWYEKQTREGRDYLLVDAATGSKRQQLGFLRARVAR